jgi:hypothetical protein
VVGPIVPRIVRGSCVRKAVDWHDSIVVRNPVLGIVCIEIVAARRMLLA